VVTLDGVDHYLGPWQSKASKAEYDRRLPAHANDRTVVELCAAYRRFAEGYYRKNGEPTRSIERVRLAPRNGNALHGLGRWDAGRRSGARALAHL
jgi:hypothetical protein